MRSSRTTWPVPADEELAVVDRLVDDVAVVLVGDEQAEYEVATALLPEGVGEASRLRVGRDSGALMVTDRDDATETAQRHKMEDRLGRRRTHGHGGRLDEEEQLGRNGSHLPSGM